MSATSIGGESRGVDSAAAGWLSLAAAPTFAMMALTTAVLGGGAEPLCAAARHGALISGMVPMYVLMSAFHVTPWLRLMSGRRAPAARDVIARSGATKQSRERRASHDPWIASLRSQ